MTDFLAWAVRDTGIRFGCRPIRFCSSVIHLGEPTHSLDTRDTCDLSLNGGNGRPT